MRRNDSNTKSILVACHLICLYFSIFQSIIFVSGRLFALPLQLCGATENGMGCWCVQLTRLMSTRVSCLLYAICVADGLLRAHLECMHCICIIGIGLAFHFFPHFGQYMCAQQIDSLDAAMRQYLLDDGNQSITWTWAQRNNFQFWKKKNTFNTSTVMSPSF